MAMPKAAAHINDRPVFGQDNVRTARQLSDILAKTKTLPP